MRCTNYNLEYLCLQRGENIALFYTGAIPMYSRTYLRVVIVSAGVYEHTHNKNVIDGVFLEVHDVNPRVVVR